VKKEKKVREKGFVIARIPSRKKRKVREKAFLIASIPPGKEDEVVKKKARNNNNLWPKIPSTKGFPPKRPETTMSCGLKSHPQRDSHQKGPRQQ
jgi:hypothetical protein